MKRKLLKMMTMCVLTISMVSGTVYAEPSENLKVTVGKNVIDIEKLAEDNHVDPYELKNAVIQATHGTHMSPFSDLKSVKSNSKASESVEVISRSVTKVTKSNQDSTAYVGYGADTASGKTPKKGMCAMKTSVTTKTGNSSSTMVKLGTTLFMEDPVNVQGTDYYSLVVEDRGSGSGRSTYWIDVCFGEYTDQNYTDATNYGIKTVSYRYYY